MFVLATTPYDVTDTELKTTLLSTGEKPLSAITPDSFDGHVSNPFLSWWVLLCLMKRILTK